MNLLDITTDSRLARLLDLISSLAGAAEADEVLAGLLDGLCRDPGALRAYLLVSTLGLPDGSYRIARLNLCRPGSFPRPPIITSAPHTGGLIARLLRTPAPKIAHDLCLDSDPGIPAVLRACRSAMAAPVFTDGHANEWAILFDERPDAFASADLEDLILRTSLVAATLNNLRVTQELCQANLRIQSEIQQIAAIQRALLPTELPVVRGLSIAAAYNAVAHAGGDMYDILPLGPHSQGTGQAADERWAILIGDVCGHGPAAAVVMTMVHSILHAFPHRPEGPAQVLEHVNRHLCAKRIGHGFVTAFLAFYDPATRKIAYARAGHNPPLLLSAGSAPFYLDEIGDLPLGIDSDCAYTQGEIQLATGQTLLLYTDGVTEAAGPDGTFFGTTGLETILAARPASPQHIIMEIQSAVRCHERSAFQQDDQTLVAIQVTG